MNSDMSLSEFKGLSKNEIKDETNLFPRQHRAKSRFTEEGQGWLPADLTQSPGRKVVSGARCPGIQHSEATAKGQRSKAGHFFEKQNLLW